MSRSEYSDDCDSWDLIRWRGAVASAIRGKRGQALLRELLAVLDAMDDKQLIAEEFINRDGQVCALGALGVSRGINVEELDYYDHDALASAYGVSQALIREIEYENDGRWQRHDNKARHAYMRKWVQSLIRDGENT